MANAKKLNEAQITALIAAAKGEDPWSALWRFYSARPSIGASRRSRSGRAASNTIAALRRRGLLTYWDVSGVSAITDAGRAALHECTGVHPAPPTVTPAPRASPSDSARIELVKAFAALCDEESPQWFGEMKDALRDVAAVLGKIVGVDRGQVVGPLSENPEFVAFLGAIAPLVGAAERK